MAAPPDPDWSADLDPARARRHINHTELVIELDGQNGVAGFIEKLRRIPLAVVEEKQRRIEEATCGKPHRIPPPL